MRRFLIAAAIGALMSGAAFAADLPTKAPRVAPTAIPYSWTGFYLGLEGGWAKSHQRWTADGGVTTGNFNGDGGLFGATAGYNWQTGMFVLGLEGDISGADIHATDTTTGGCSIAAPCHARIDAVGTLRARLGITTGQWLFYVTGGGAAAEIKNSQTLLSPLATASSTQGGWTAGAGIEVGLWGNWSAKAEYLRVDIGHSPFCPAAGCGVVVRSDYSRLDIVRLGLNYKLGGPY